MFYHVLSSMLRYQGSGFIFGTLFSPLTFPPRPLHLWDRQMTETNEVWPAGRTFSAQNKVTILHTNNPANDPTQTIHRHWTQFWWPESVKTSAKTCWHVHAFAFCDGPPSLRKIYQNICRMHLWNFGQIFANAVLQALLWAGFGRFNLYLWSAPTVIGPPHGPTCLVGLLEGLSWTGGHSISGDFPNRKPPKRTDIDNKI